MKKFLFLLLISCTTDYSPKPKGYPYIEMPEASYTVFSESKNLSFEVSEAANVVNMRDSDDVKWFDIEYKKYKASIFCTFFNADSKKILTLADETKRLAELHTAKGGKIEEAEYERVEDNVFGKLYLLGGNTASPVQFALTDNKSRFLRGALHFEYAVNRDSIAPVVDYIYQDIRVLMESVKWK